MAETEPELKDLLVRVHVDRNLDSWPLWVPADSRSTPDVRVFEREIRLPDGSTATASVTVGKVAHLGPLTTEDQKVLLGLIKLWQDAGRPETLRFSLRQLARVLNRGWGQHERKDLRRSLDRLSDTPMDWVHSYHDTRLNEKVRLLRKFRILADLKIADRESAAVNTAECEARFHEIALANLRAFHTRPVLLGTVVRFRSGVAQLLYRYADPLLFAAPRITRRSADLFVDLGLDSPRYKKRSNRKGILERAFRELEGAELSNGDVLACSLGTAKDGDLLVVFESRKCIAPAAEGLTAPIAARPSTEALAPPADPAADLVRHFHRAFFDVERPRPGAREIVQARDLLARAGDLETARAVVEWARAEARRTDFRVASFGAVAQYVDRALADLGARAAEWEVDPRREETAACAICGGAGSLVARWPDGRTQPVPCPHDHAQIDAWIVEKGITIERPAAFDEGGR